MPDWNPAEIIGLKPKNLSYTMYKELITDQIWADQRANYGFEKIFDNPLMIKLFGTPYIDMRVNFNSWLPRNLSNITKEKLANFYLTKFKKNKEFHDKIEFKIIYSCFVLNTSKKLTELNDYGFSDYEINCIKNELKKITRLSIKNFYSDISKIQKLPKTQLKVINSNLDIIQKIYYLNKNCKLLGTLPLLELLEMHL